MQIRKKLIQASRRGFLRKGVIVGGAVTAGSGVANATNTETPSLVAEPKGAQGYSKTEHVQAYYKRARF